MSRHSEELYAGLARMDVDVTVFVRKAQPGTTGRYRDMEVVPVWAPSGRGLETLVYGAIASFRALFGGFDVVHYQGVASASFCWLQRLRPGRKVVITHHRQDWLDEKWGAFARALLRWTAAISLRLASDVIAVSEDLAKDLRRMHDRPIEVIPNGITLPPSGGIERLSSLGLTPKGYVLSVGRLVPEKRLEVLIAAFEKLDRRDLDLAIVGAPRYSEDYAASLQKGGAERVKFLGLQTGEALGTLYANAAVFATASLREGLPMAVLEAMGSSIPVVASDIPAHREAMDGWGVLFDVDDADAFAKGLEAALDDQGMGEKAKEVIARRGYNWDAIVARTFKIVSAPSNAV